MNEPFNLVSAVTNIMLKRVSEEEAKQFALDNFGELCAYIRAKQVSYLLTQRPPKPVRVATGQAKRRVAIGGKVGQRRKELKQQQTIKQEDYVHH